MRNNLDIIPDIPSSRHISKTTRGKIIYVEGKNDEEVFRNIVNKDWQVLKFGSTKGTTGKENIINHFSNDNVLTNKIAIVDRDYDEIKEIPNIFYTDYNDIENTAINLMEINSIKNCLDIKEINDQNSFEKIYYLVSKISNQFSNLWRYKNQNNIRYLKYITNESNCDNLINDIVNLNECTINYNKLYKYYENYLYKINSNILYQIMNPTIPDNNNLFRGHDFFYFLTKHLLFKYNISTSEYIERDFIRNSIKYNWILKSNLYNDIKNKYNCFK